MTPAYEGTLAALADPRRIFVDLPGGNVEAVLTDMVRRLAASGSVTNGEELARRLLKREGQGCTGLGGGIAIPHCTVPGLSDIVFALGSCPTGVDFGASDGIPVTLLFLILSPPDAPAANLQALARISRLLKSPGTAESLRAARSSEEVIETLREAETGQTVGRL